MMSRGIVRRFILQYRQYQNICCVHSYHGSGHDLVPAVARRHCPFDLHATFLRVVPRPNAMLAVPAGSSACLPRRWPPCRVLFFFASLLSSVARMFLLYFLHWSSWIKEIVPVLVHSLRFVMLGPFVGLVSVTTSSRCSRGWV